MKRFVLPALVAAFLSLAPVASAQVGVAGGGDTDIGHTHSGADDGTGRTPRTPGTGRTPGTERTPGTGRTPGTERTPGTPRTPGTERIPGTPRTGRIGDAPSSLPRTGSNTAAIAMDGAALLGAGLVLMRARRRLALN